MIAAFSGFRSVPRLILVGVFCLTLNLDRQALGQDGITLANGAAPPKSFLQEGGAPRMRWGIIGGELPRTTPDEKSQAVAGRPAIAFGQAFYTAAEHSTPTATFDLLALPDKAGGFSQHVGWVNRQTLLLGRAAEFEPKSLAQRKVIIVNTVVSLQKRRSGDLLEFSSRLAPSWDAKPGPTVRLMDMYFRYAERGGWILIGPDPDLYMEPGQQEAALLGWVLAEMTAPFDGRLAAEWETKANPDRLGRIYRNPADAYTSLDPATLTAPLFVEQTLDPVQKQPGAGLTRFPLLEHTGDADYPRIDPKTNNLLLKVWGMGAFLDADEAHVEIEKVKAEIQKLQARLDHPTQILFVVDDTQSMKVHFPRVAATIKGILRDVASGKRGPVKVAIAYYNDIGARPKGTPLGYETMELRKISSGEIISFASRVESHDIVGGDDFPERLFKGLEEAIAQAKWDENSEAPKAVFLIGDHGDKPERAEPARIVEALNAHGGPIAFHVFQVVDPEVAPATGNYRTERHEAAQFFRDQTKEIIKRQGGAPRATYKVVEGEGAELTADLDRKFDELKNEEKALNEKLEKLKAREFPAKVGPELEGSLKNLGVALNEIKSFDGLRVANVGYVWKYQPDAASLSPRPKNVRIKVLSSREEIRKLADVLSFVDEPAFRDDPLEFLKRKVGPDQSKSFEGALLRPLSLQAQSLLLTQSLNRMTASRAKPLAVELTRRRAALAELARPIDPPNPRFFRTHGGRVDLCWIDFEDELP